MRRRSTILVALAIVASSLAVGTATLSARSAADASYYVSLGDSLAVGYQPGLGETRQGYVDVLRQSVNRTMPSLVAQKFGCPGETSSSLITGHGSPCDYPAGSQLDAAVAFLRSHPGQVPFITVDIGSNDIVDACLDFETLQFDRGCVATLVPVLRGRVAQIVDVLRAAAGPNVPILGMTYYNPFLGLWVLPNGHALARAAQPAWAEFNAGLTLAYEDGGAVVVDVAATFRVDDFDDVGTLHGQYVPLNVAVACRWTWFCSKEAFGDPHANSTGYERIAQAFYGALAPLVA